MEYKGIIITGTSGSGKSIVVSKLCEKFDIFQRVQSTTTRGKRNDDEPGTYVYLSKEEFSDLEKEGKFMITSTYREEKYGIKVEDFEEVMRNGKLPVMVLTPEATDQLDKNSQMKDKFMIIFLDASDETLNKRLKEREDPDAAQIQREMDRKYKDEMWERENCPIYCIKNENTSIDNIINLIYYLYEYRNTGGLLPKNLIKLMIKCGLLLENAELDYVQGSSYDLRLGMEYFHNGLIKTLDDQEPFITLNPGDYAIVSSLETANFPKDIAGKFDLSVGLFCRGIILSNGPQVDPGFKGKLFCLLFNSSNRKIQLKLKQHYATIEFLKLFEPTKPYKGKYQSKENIMEYLPEKAEASAINVLWKDVEKLKEIKWYERTLPLIIAIFGWIIAIIAIIIALVSNMNTSSPNSEHTAMVLRTSAQIQQSRTSYVRRTLDEMQSKFLEERGAE